MKRILYILTFIACFSLKAAQENPGNPINRNLPSLILKAVQRQMDHRLNSAIKTGNLQEIENLLQQGVNSEGAFHLLVNCPNPPFQLSFDLVEQILNLFIKYKLDINELYNYQTVLCHALSSCYNFEIIQLLIKYGANVNKGDDYDRNIIPLISMTCYNYNCYKLLVENNADINQQIVIFNEVSFDNVRHGSTVLLRSIACLEDPLYLNNPAKIILDLLIRGADITLIRGDSKTFFDYLTNQNLLQIVFEFITYILEAEGELKGAPNALLVAAYLNEAHLVRQLLEKGIEFSSEKYELYFNNLIEDKPEIHAVIREYKNNLANNIIDQSQLIPDIACIISEF